MTGILVAQRATTDVENADRIFLSPLQDKTGTLVTELSIPISETSPAAESDI